MKIKKILVSQPRPELERSPYFEIARTYGIDIDFRPFIQIEPIPSRDFRKNRIDILSYGAVIMTSKNAVDHYFRMCNELRIIVPETMKYFCLSEATAYYLQKYIQFRKRKIFSSNYSFADLVEIIKKKHKEEKFLLPCAVDSSDEYTELLDKEGIRYVKAPMYRAIYSTLSDIDFSQYDIVVLFSSAGVSSLLSSFPKFHENKLMIATFGEQTALAVLQAGLKLHIHAPQPHAPSMAMALDQYLKGEQTNQPWQQAPFPSLNAPKKEEKKAIAKPQNVKPAPVKPAQRLHPIMTPPAAIEVLSKAPVKAKPTPAKPNKPAPPKPKAKPAPKKVVVKKNVQAVPAKKHTVMAKQVKKQPAKSAKKPATIKSKSNSKGNSKRKKLVGNKTKPKAKGRR